MIMFVTTTNEIAIFNLMSQIVYREISTKLPRSFSFSPQNYCEFRGFTYCGTANFDLSYLGEVQCFDKKFYYPFFNNLSVWYYDKLIVNPSYVQFHFFHSNAVICTPKNLVFNCC